MNVSSLVLPTRTSPEEARVAACAGPLVAFPLHQIVESDKFDAYPFCVLVVLRIEGDHPNLATSDKVFSCADDGARHLLSETGMGRI